jgi:hypothetical protein
MSSGGAPLDELFASARDDAPSSAVRDAVWERVASATALPAGVAGVAGAATAVKAASISATKLLALGAVVGAAGAAAAVLVIGVTPILGDGPAGTTARSYRTPSVMVTGSAAGARLAENAPRSRAVAAPFAAASGAPCAPHDEASSLLEEARLVTEARSALVRGNPDGALAFSRTTHTLPVRALEPEELALEARALRALGRTDEALATELTLRRRFPTHALAR